MKLFLIGLAIIVSILVMVGVLVTELNDLNRLKQKEIDHWKKVNKEQADTIKLLKPCQ